jgi:Mg/Co/Ni transporter MgtE
VDFAIYDCRMGTWWNQMNRAFIVSSAAGIATGILAIALLLWLSVPVVVALIVGLVIARRVGTARRSGVRSNR